MNSNDKKIVVDSLPQKNAITDSIDPIPETSDDETTSIKTIPTTNTRSSDVEKDPSKSQVRKTPKRQKRVVGEATQKRFASPKGQVRLKVLSRSVKAIKLHGFSL